MIGFSKTETNIPLAIVEAERGKPKRATKAPLCWAMAAQFVFARLPLTLVPSRPIPSRCISLADFHWRRVAQLAPADKLSQIGPNKGEGLDGWGLLAVSLSDLLLAALARPGWPTRARSWINWSGEIGGRKRERAKIQSAAGQLEARIAALR